MEYSEKVYEKLMANYNLLCNVIKPATNGPELKVDLSKVESIINKKIPDTLKDNAPEDFYELYTDFKSEYEKFKDFILYDKLIGKNIVALGGGFSSGKSSFLNSLMGKSVLPSDIDPSTSVPTYIVRGEKHEAMGINVFDNKVYIPPQDIRRISHGFGSLENDDDEQVTDAVTLGHVLENIFFSTPWHQYDSIAFLDTPGYSKPDSEKYSAKTDEQIARGQLNSSNYILWFVEAGKYMTEEDIKFIKTLREDIPKLIIANKADGRDLTELKDIIDKIKASLDIKGVRYVDVLAFTSRMEQVGDEKAREFIEQDKEKIRNQIEEWNSQIYESNFARNFKILFVRCKDFYEAAIDEESRKLSRLNTTRTFLSEYEDIDPQILESLNSLLNDTRKRVEALKAISKKLKELQDEFFTEIKFISDIVGIAMPEPSEIDLLQDRVRNPLQIIESYKKNKGIRTDRSVVDMLQNMFDGIKPIINKSAGGSEYCNELMDVIMSVCDVKQEDIRMNDVFKNTEEYTALISNI